MSARTSSRLQRRSVAGMPIMCFARRRGSKATQRMISSLWSQCGIITARCASIDTQRKLQILTHLYSPSFAKSHFVTQSRAQPARSLTWSHLVNGSPRDPEAFSSCQRVKQLRVGRVETAPQSLSYRKHETFWRCNAHRDSKTGLNDLTQDASAPRRDSVCHVVRAGISCAHLRSQLHRGR